MTTILASVQRTGHAGFTHDHTGSQLVPHTPAKKSRTLLDQLGLQEGAQIKIRQGRGEAVLATQIDAAVPPGVVRIAAAHPSTCGLEGLSGPVTVEKA